MKKIFSPLKGLILILLLAGSSLFAKDEIHGKVYGIDVDNDKLILVSATVQWLGTGIGTYTDDNGRFKIERTSATNKLVISFTGYEKDTIEVGEEDSKLDITLKANLTTEEIRVEARQPGNVLNRSDILNSQDITGHGLRKAACCNLSESFETNPSVDVSYTDALSGAKRIELLGLDGIYTQLMTEKIPNLRGIATAYGLSYIPGTWMESIQISKGASSVTTGFESTTGQINVEYKKNESSEPFFLNLYGNHVGRMEGNFNTAYDLNDQVQTTLFFHGSSLRNEIDHNGDSFIDQPMTDQVNLMNRWIIQNDNLFTNIGVKALYENRSGGQVGYTGNDNTGLYGLNIHTERYEVFAKNGYLFDDEKSSLAAILSGSSHYQDSYFGRNDYLAKQYSFYANVLFESGFGSQDNDSNAAMDESKATGHDCSVLDLPHKYSVGLSYRYDEFDEVFNTVGYYKKESIPGAFLEYTYQGLEDLVMVGGARVDYHNMYGNFFTPRFHIKYNLDDFTILKASVGKGYRIPNILAENTALLGSSRELFISDGLKPEEAWNAGMNLTYDFLLADHLFTLNAEYYYTSFVNQVVVDLDQSAGAVYFYNLDGRSYSNSFQVDLTFEPVERFDVTTAYRLNDVQVTTGGELQQKPLISRHKAFLNLAYSTQGDDWMFDYTIDYSGGGRIPNTSNNPAGYRLEDRFPAFVKMNAQVTKKFGNLAFYVGGENLTDYKQTSPILAYDDPYGNYFDSSMIWGPIIGRKIYAGLRWEVY